MKITDDSVLDLANGIIKQALADLKEDLKHIEKGHFQYFRFGRQSCLSEHDALNIIDFLESKEYNLTNLDGWTLIRMMCKEMYKDGI